MTYHVTYHRDKKRRSEPVRHDHYKNMGNWRSRWERKRDIDRRDPRKDHITNIFTRPTDKDYIVTKVHGVSPDGLYFRAVPATEKAQSRSKRGHTDVVEVRNARECKSCNNYVRRFYGYVRSFYHKKQKK